MPMEPGKTDILQIISLVKKIMMYLCKPAKICVLLKLK